MKPLWSKKPALLLLPLVAECWGSLGDRSLQFQHCLGACQAANCSQDGGQFVTDYQQPSYLRALRWGCADECRYECMWRSVDQFQENQQAVPQFYGKWPFRRILGVQEPASMLFSLLNLLMHLRLLQRFRSAVRPGAPLRWLWLFYGAVCCHAWIWSAVFHTRDLPWTEFLDYVCAFSIILVNCYAMCVRVVPDVLGAVFPRKASLIPAISLGFLLVFLKHAAYLRGRFDYGYNILVNIFVGGLTSVGWLVWSWKYHPKPSYVRSCRLYVFFSALVLLLEVLDSPPWFFLVDNHALWHLATAPPLVYIYRFAMDDCRYLRSMERRGLLGGKSHAHGRMD